MIILYFAIAQVRKGLTIIIISRPNGKDDDHLYIFHYIIVVI